MASAWRGMVLPWKEKGRRYVVPGRDATKEKKKNKEKYNLTGRLHVLGEIFGDLLQYLLQLSKK